MSDTCRSCGKTVLRGYVCPECLTETNPLKDVFLAQNTFAASSDVCRDCGKWLGKGYLCDDCDTVDGWE